MTPEQQSDTAGAWPYKEFTVYLDDVLRAAGIPDSKRTGRPNIAEFAERTGIDAARPGKWASGKLRPTADALRKIADAFADDLDMPVDELYSRLMTAAGFGASSSSSTPPIEWGAMAAIKRLYIRAGEEDREWIRGKLADLQEQIEMRMTLSQQTKRGS
ncbi:helix-turn-helix domain-containing protein [Glycomyces sp. NPDC048151]|uniref:helix-turn-helix domain-containing protein n=1 Tax=Glycomyces sp. NPDC048151 TaxID=3364002 RepID=UPI003723D335